MRSGLGCIVRCMKKHELKAQAVLAKQLLKYEKMKGANTAAIKALRLKLTKSRNREQYLRRCIQSIKAQLGHIKEGQLTFNI